MAGFFRLHNKFHRSSHHTLSSTLVQDQGIDPIASEKEPFNGIFYNNLTDQENSYNILTNSYDWYSTYSTVCSLSSNWDSIATTYTTVCANSAKWNDGYSAYLTLCAVSGNYESVYSTVYANSANWGNENILYTDKVQENTRSKTFSGYTLSINEDNTVDWNLDIAQVAYLNLDRNVIIKNPLSSSIKNGGLYNLFVIQDSSIGNHTLTFENQYQFPVGIDISSDINFSPSGATIFNFLCDGVFMYGDFYKTNPILPTPTPTTTTTCTPTYTQTQTPTPTYTQTQTPTPTVTPTITPTNRPANIIVRFESGDDIVRFVDGDSIVIFEPLTPTPTPTPTLTPTNMSLNVVMFGNSDNIVKFIDGDPVIIFQ